MANHAKLIRDSEVGKPIVKRDRHSIHFQNPDGSRRAVFTIDPLHWGVDEDQEIDTTWQPDVGAWQWKLSENRFDIRARSVLNSGDIVQWTDKDTGEYVTLQPLALNWVDNVTDSRQQITQPQAVAAVANDCELYWQDGYGTGRHFKYTAHPRRLIKHVTIDALSYLPTPTVSNPYLEIEFILKKSAGITLYVDGVPWDFSTKTVTANRIEFRTSGGIVTWYFDAPGANDSSVDGNFCPGIFQLRRQGATRYCTVRIPKTWIDGAVFPISIDPTFTDGYGGDATTYIDNWIDQLNSATNNGSSGYMYACLFASGRLLRELMKFTLTSLEDVTINSADLYATLVVASTNAVNVYRILSGNNSWTETGSCWNFQTGAVAWAGSTGCGTSGTDYSASSMGQLPAHSGINQEISASLDLTEFASMISGNYGLILIAADEGTTKNNNYYSSDYATTGYRPKLVVDYTPIVTQLSNIFENSIFNSNIFEPTLVR